MMYECQTRGEHSGEQFDLLLITFDTQSHIHPLCNGQLVGEIDPETVRIKGHGESTNITAALELLLRELKPYMQKFQGLPESDRSRFALPLVFLFSDGEHNCGDPQPNLVADEIKKLMVGRDPVIIAAAGVAVDGGQPDEKMLRSIAHPGCYAHITNLDLLVSLIGEVSRSAATTADGIAKLIKRIMDGK